MFGFNVNKLKPNLKMAVHRIGIVKNKKANAAVAVRREIATLLEDGKEEKARIRVEGIIRDDFTVEGYEILELLCDLVAERANLVKTERECPYDMREAVCTLIWAANRTEIPELVEVKKQLVKKYGQDFAAAASRNVDGCVNERVIQKLSVQPPSAYLVVNYMKEIAKQFKVDWEPDEQAIVDPLAAIPAPTGMSVASAGVSGPSFVSLYSTLPPSQQNLASSLPAAPTEKPVDSSAFHVPHASASSRYFAPPPPAAGGPPVNQYAPPPATAYATQPRDSSQYAQQQYQQHDSQYTQPSQQQQHHHQHHHQHHQQHHQQHQSSSYVGPHASVPTPPPAAPPAATQPPQNTSNGTKDPSPGDSSIPDFDELTARFERLRKRQDLSSTSFTF